MLSLMKKCTWVALLVSSVTISYANCPSLQKLKDQLPKAESLDASDCLGNSACGLTYQNLLHDIRKNTTPCMSDVDNSHYAYNQIKLAQLYGTLYYEAQAKQAAAQSHRVPLSYGETNRIQPDRKKMLTPPSQWIPHSSYKKAQTMQTLPQKSRFVTQQPKETNKTHSSNPWFH